MVASFFLARFGWRSARAGRMAKKPAASFRGGLYDGLSSLGVTSSSTHAPSVSSAAPVQQDAKPAAATPGWAGDGVKNSFMTAINMRKKAAAHHAPSASKPKPVTAPQKAPIAASSSSSIMSTVDNTPEEDVQDRYDPLKPNEYDHYAKGRRIDFRAEESSSRREEPPRKVQATGPISIFADQKYTFPKKNPISMYPTTVVLLLNMTAPGGIDPQLEADTASECGKFGRVLRCVVREFPGSLEEEVTRIFVRFADVTSADKAFNNLNGRFFSGRKVRAAYYDERTFDVEFA